MCVGRNFCVFPYLEKRWWIAAWYRIPSFYSEAVRITFARKDGCNYNSPRIMRESIIPSCLLWISFSRFPNTRMSITLRYKRCDLNSQIACKVTTIFWHRKIFLVKGIVDGIISAHWHRMNEIILMPPRSGQWCDILPHPSYFSVNYED